MSDNNYNYNSNAEYGNKKVLNMNRYELSNGLQLKDNTIHQISGPITMQYLKPINNLFFKTKKNNLPLVLLWGDHHREDTGLCPNCECDDKTKPCCYKIYDPNFLKELDKLASIYPIDFYTEYSPDFPESNNSKNILFDRFLDKTVKDCHTKTLRSKKIYNRLCPTQNIRWHFADTRYTLDTIERHIFFVPRETLLFRKRRDLPDFFDDETKSIEEKRPHFYKVLKWINDEIFKNPYNPNTRHHQLRKEGIETYLQLIKIILTPISYKDIYTLRNPTEEEQKELSIDNDTQILVPHKKYLDLFRVYVTAMSKEKRSMIYKQIQKIKSPLKNDEELVLFLASIYIECNLRDIIQMEKGYTWKNKKLMSLIQLCITNPHFFTNTSIQDELTKITSDDIYNAMSIIFLIGVSIVSVEVTFLDIYALFRMMKQPEESSPPFLSMGFFGATHSNNIVRILQLAPYFNYELVYQVEGTEQSKKYRKKRCLTITEPVPLASDLEEHAQRVLSQPNSQKMYQNYMNVIKKERESREKEEKNTNGVMNISLGGKRRIRKTIRKRK